MDNETYMISQKPYLNEKWQHHGVIIMSYAEEDFFFFTIKAAELSELGLFEHCVLPVHYEI